MNECSSFLGLPDLTIFLPKALKNLQLASKHESMRKTQSGTMKLQEDCANRKLLHSSIEEYHDTVDNTCRDASFVQPKKRTQ